MGRDTHIFTFGTRSKRRNKKPAILQFFPPLDDLNRQVPAKIQVFFFRNADYNDIREIPCIFSGFWSEQPISISKNCIFAFFQIRDSCTSMFLPLLP